jgi:hypothetical protein
MVAPEILQFYANSMKQKPNRHSKLQVPNHLSESHRALVITITITIGFLLYLGTVYDPNIVYGITSITIAWAISDWLVDRLVLRRTIGEIRLSFLGTYNRLAVGYLSYLVGIVAGSLLSEAYGGLIVAIIKAIPNVSTTSTPTSVAVSSILAALSVWGTFRRQHMVQPNEEAEITEKKEPNEQSA